jgi:hypothetical protein
MRYRIEWASLLTNFKSNGDWFGLKDKQMLEDSITYMNKKYKGEFMHWLMVANRNNVLVGGGVTGETGSRL